MYRVKNHHILIIVWLVIAAVVLWFLFVSPQAL